MPVTEAMPEKSKMFLHFIKDIFPVAVPIPFLLQEEEASESGLHL